MGAECRASADFDRRDTETRRMCSSPAWLALKHCGRVGDEPSIRRPGFETPISFRLRLRCRYFGRYLTAASARLLVAAPSLRITPAQFLRSPRRFRAPRGTGHRLLWPVGEGLRPAKFHEKVGEPGCRRAGWQHGKPAKAGCGQNWPPHSAFSTPRHDRPRKAMVCPT